MSYAHPASIQARAGAVLGKIELQVEQVDLAGMVNFVRLLRAYCAAYLEEEKDLLTEYEKIPAFSYATCKTEDDAWTAEISKVSVLTRLLKRKNIMGYDTVAMGDSHALEAEALE